MLDFGWRARENHEKSTLADFVDKNQITDILNMEQEL
jgi:hypothetical protein